MLENDQKGAGSLEGDLDTLRTKVIQRCHNLTMTSHPGREGTASIVGRDYYWPLQTLHIRRFCRNCDACGRNKVWRELKHELLQPLLVPDRFFQEISMDFMVGLPESGGCTNLWVIKDRLSKNILLEAMPMIKAEDYAIKFLEY
jgi:hypothetical protein